MLLDYVASKSKFMIRATFYVQIEEYSLSIGFSKLQKIKLTS